MATGDFQDLYTRAIYAAQRDPSVAFDVTRAKEAINEAYLRVCDSGPHWSFLTVSGGPLALTNGATSVSFASIATAMSLPSVYQVYGVTTTGSAGSVSTVSPPQHVSWEDYQQIRQQSTAAANGAPTIWTTHSSGQLLYFPPSSSSYSFQFQALRGAVELVNNADVPLIPLQWRAPLLIPCAAAILLRQEGGEALQEAAAHEAVYEKNLERALAALSSSEPAFNTPVDPFQISPMADLVAASGSLRDIAYEVCYQTGAKWWSFRDYSLAVSAINRVYLSLINSQDEWDFLEQEGQITLTSGQDLYSISSIASALGVNGIRELRSVIHDSILVQGQGPLEPLSWQELEALARSTQDNELSGIPAVYAVWDGKVRFWPKPDQAYSLGVFVLKGDTEKSLPADTFLIPTEWLQEVLVPLAAAKVLSLSNDTVKFQRGQVLESQGQAALKNFREARAAAKRPTLRLQSPTFSSDLPSSYVDDGYL